MQKHLTVFVKYVVAMCRIMLSYLRYLVWFWYS